MKHIMIAIPAYTGVVHMGTMRSLINDTIELVKRGDRFTLVDDIGNALIADSRGVIATRFWESDCDELIFIDSDVTWQAGALLKLVDYWHELFDTRNQITLTDSRGVIGIEFTAF